MRGLRIKTPLLIKNLPTLLLYNSAIKNAILMTFDVLDDNIQ